ncbi:MULTISPECIES: hypothetical protein [Mesorhizobium]|nr:MULTISPECIES: hypothetical protein [Mesorhizobium]
MKSDVTMVEVSTCISAAEELPRKAPPLYGEAFEEHVGNRRLF